MSLSFHLVISTPQDALTGWFTESNQSVGDMFRGNARPFTADLYDASGRKVLKVERKHTAAMYVYAYSRQSDGTFSLLGKVEKKYRSWLRHYDISFAQKQDQFAHLFQLDAQGERNWIFSVRDSAGQERAVVSRRSDECVSYHLMFRLLTNTEPKP